MSNLKTYKFSDLYEMSSGISSKPEQAGSGTHFLSFSTVFKNHFLPENLQDLMSINEAEMKVYSILEGDIFLTRTSETLDELGMSSVAVKAYPKASYSGFLKRLRPIQEGVAYHKYMAFYLRSKLFRKTMTNNAIMTLRASLNEQIFSYLQLILPPYCEQKKIGDFLYQINLKIELNNRINTELEAMAKLIYEYWFVQFDFPFDFAKGKPADDSSKPQDIKPYKSGGGKMVWNKELKREIPEGWEVKELKDIAEITMGQSPPGESYNENSEGTVFYQGCTNFGNRFPTIRKFSTMPTRFANEGDLLLSVRAPVGAINISKEHCCIGRGLASLAAKNGQKTFLFGVMQNLKQIFDRRNVDGTTFGAITKNDLFTIKVIKPEKSVLDHFHRTTITSFNKQNKCELENIQLSSIRDWLLPMLMNGQINIMKSNIQ